MKRFLSLRLVIAILAASPDVTEAGPFKVHGIFASNMVLQRDKPIMVWGWAEPGKSVSVQLGKDKADAKAAGDIEWAEGTYPTPHGIIKVRHDRQPDGSIKSDIETPPGVELVK